MRQTACTLSVIIVNINQKDLLEKCLRSVFREVRGTSFEVIVVDNGSTDGSCEMVRSLFPEVRLIAVSGRRGFAENYNIGIRTAHGDYLLILNNDTELLPYVQDEQNHSDRKLLDEMVQRLESQPQVACLGPMLLYPDGKLQVECARNLPTLSGVVFGVLWLDQFFPQSEMFGKFNMTYWDHAAEKYVDCISGACMLARASMIDQLGGFDELFFLYAEDADLCRRMRDAGYLILYVPEFKVRHASGQTIQTRESYAGKVEAVLSIYKYFRKHNGSIYAWVFRVVVGSLILLRIAFIENRFVAPLFKRPALPIRARADAVTNLMEWRSMYTGRNA